MDAELGLSDSIETKDQDHLMATISSQVTKQEDQLLAEALLLEDLPADAVLQVVGHFIKALLETLCTLVLF